MIKLTKLDNTPIAVSLASIKYAESTPDTLIFFLNGDSLIVKESLEELIAKSSESLSTFPPTDPTQQKAPGDHSH